MLKILQSSDSGLSKGILESSESAEFVDKLLRSATSDHFKSGSSLNSKQLHALFLSSKNKECSRGATSEHLRTSSSTLMNEIPDLNSSAWLPSNTAIDNDAISKTIFLSDDSPQFPNHSQSQSLDARDPELNRTGKTDWDQLLDDGLPPSAVSPPQPPLAASAARTPRKSKTRKPISRKRTNKCRRPEPKCKVFFKVRDNDVLFGRGGLVNHHPGNRRYLRLKEAMQQRYFAAQRKHRAAISKELVAAVHGWGGRFLKREEGTKDSWYEAHDGAAQEKASQTLREINTPERRATKRAKYTKKSR